MADNTVILLLSDNGEMTGDYMLGGKELLYDASIRIPMIILDPRVPQPARQHHCGEMVLNIDVAPTILALAGATVPESMQGRSPAPLLRGNSPQWRDDFFLENNFQLPSQYYPIMEGVRTDEWEYIRYPEMDPVVEQLFDLVHDPRETEDLAGRDICADTLARLRSRCDQFAGQGQSD